MRKKAEFLLFLSIALALAAPLAAQTVTVTSPNGGENWTKGTPHAITWNFTNPGSATVDIILRKNDVKVGDIKTGVALSAGTWTWQSVGTLVGGAQVDGNGYVVRIKITGSATHDDSNGTFNITPAPTLQLLAPNGGESWVRGSQHNVAWKAENWTGNVQLVLYRNGAYQGVIASSLPSTPGVYSWKVGTFFKGQNQALADFGQGYRVTVSRTASGPLAPYPGLQDQSDGDFAISAMQIEGTPSIAQAKVAKTVTLQASVANKWYRKHKWSGFGTASEPRPDPAPLMRTGYTNSYNSGIDSEYWGYIYRGILQFDFSQIKGKVTEAHVILVCTGTDSTDGVPYCDGSVMVLDGPGDGFNNPRHHYVNLPAGGGNLVTNILKVNGPNIQIIVTPVVIAWINGSQPNYGLQFLGNNENMDDESNDRCVSHFQVSLSVTYLPGD